MFFFQFFLRRDIYTRLLQRTGSSRHGRHFRRIAAGASSCFARRGAENQTKRVRFARKNGRSGLVRLSLWCKCRRPQINRNATATDASAGTHPKPPTPSPPRGKNHRRRAVKTSDAARLKPPTPRGKNHRRRARKSRNNDTEDVGRPTGRANTKIILL